MRKWILLFTCALGACVAKDIHGPRPLKPQELAIAPYSPAWTEEMTGSLAYENGCLLFRDDRAGAPFTPIWPVGSVFNGTSVIFHSPGKADQPTIINEHITIAVRPADWSSLDPAYYAPFRNQCAASPVFVTALRPAD